MTSKGEKKMKKAKSHPTYARLTFNNAYKAVHVPEIQDFVFFSLLVGYSVSYRLNSQRNHFLVPWTFVKLENNSFHLLLLFNFRV